MSPYIIYYFHQTNTINIYKTHLKQSHKITYLRIYHIHYSSLNLKLIIAYSVLSFQNHSHQLLIINH